MTSSFGFLLPLLSLPPYPYPGIHSAEEDTITAIRCIPEAPVPDHTTSSKVLPSLPIPCSVFGKPRRPAGDVAFDDCSQNTPLLPYAETDGGKQDEPRGVG